MSDYLAPIQDLKFLLQSVAPLGELNQLPAYADATPDVVEAVLEEAGKFARDVLGPINYSADQEGAKHHAGNTVTTPKGFKEAYKAFAEGGWNGLPAPQDFGGGGLPTTVATSVQEMWHASNMSFGLCPMLTQGAIEALILAGSDELKNTYLEKMVTGAWTGTMNLTEPQAGSDLALVRTSATPAHSEALGHHYLVKGTKIFITYGEHDWTENIVHMVLARLPDAPAGVKGISLFLVPKFLVNKDGSLGARNDVYCTSLEHKLGIHGSPTAVLQYGDHTGAVGYLVGKENNGLAYMFIMMNLARFAVGIQGIGLAERSYQHAVAYARERVQSRDVGGAGGGQSVSIIHHPDVRRMLMSMRTQTEAMRALALYTAHQLDLAHHGDAAQKSAGAARSDLLIPVVKGWCTEAAQNITYDGIQVHGGMGFIEETGAAQYYRDARIITIYEGTTAIQANDLIGRKMAREGGVAARALVLEQRATAAELNASDNVVLKRVGQRFAPAVEALANATEWVMANWKDNIYGCFAGSVPMIKLYGIVCGGWQLARVAQMAQMPQFGAEPEYAKNKLISLGFFADTFFPQAVATAETIMSGQAEVMALAEAAF
ncbi:MAG: hypothetical protein RLZZ502_1874 [Pseudomonadota bacterium]